MTAEPASGRRAEERAGGGGGLLERAVELERLAALLAGVRRGEGGMALVEGPAGIGKSRLLAEARRLAGEARVHVLSARGGELERDFSYGVVRQLFEPALALSTPRERGSLLDGAAGLAAPLFERPGIAAEGAGGGEVSFATLHGLYWLAANLAAREATVLVIDDLQWADAPSLRFLLFLLRRMEGQRLGVVAAMRPGEPGADDLLLGELLADPATLPLRPSALTPEASARLIRDTVDPDAADEFCRACHDASGGNPLLMQELVGAVAAEGLPASARHAGRVREIGAHAVSRRLRLRLARMPPAAAELARAAAVLGDGAGLREAAALAGLDELAAGEAASALARAEILGADVPLSFVHPMVRAAVYAEMTAPERQIAHRRAAALLRDAGAEAERIAGHALLVAPAGDAATVETLREAARAALGRGAADVAMRLLRRAHDELPAAERPAELLVELGAAEMMVDARAAVERLSAALARIEEPARRGEVALLLGRAQFLVDRIPESAATFERAAGELEPSEIRRRLEGALLIVAVNEPDLFALAERRLDALRDRVEPSQDAAGQMLLGLLAYHDARTLRADAPESTRRALAALAEGRLYAAGMGGAYAFPLLVLTMAGSRHARATIEAALAGARARGSAFTFSSAMCFRSQLSLMSGDVQEAEADAREALAASEALGLTVGLPYVRAFLADALMEAGKVDEAEACLGEAGLDAPVRDTAHMHWLLDSRVRLRLARGDAAGALETALDCGRRYARVGGRNPAIMAWRTQAAAAHLALGRPDAAHELALEELELARAWGAPRSIGRALRYAGLAAGGAQGIALLEEAVDALAGSGARLEEARALTELGAALRRANQRSRARDALRQGLDIATRAGAAVVADQARVELQATGARPRSVVLSGAESLTPSERRVAAMAAEGRSNRDIAQALFVTPKTVEVHLGNAYRKLGIRSRMQLRDALPAEAVPA